MVDAGTKGKGASRIERGRQYVERVLNKIGHLSLDELDQADLGAVIPDELNIMLEYLPIEFSDESEEKYISALMLAAQTSCENGLFQFAYIQYHMLFMTAVYYVLLKATLLQPEELEKALYYLLKDRYSDIKKPSNTKNGKLYFGSFAIVNESDVFLLLRVMGLDNNLLGELQKLVQERNRYAHANGHLLLTSDELFLEALNTYNAKILRVVELLRPSLIEFYIQTVTNPDFFDPEIRAYLDPDEQIIQELIKKYALSRTEINWLRKIKTSTFDEYDGADQIKALHAALNHYYRILTRGGCNPFDDSYILNKYQNNATEFVERELGISAYECGKHGGEFPIYECPECMEEQLAFDSETRRAHCFVCNIDYESGELSFCEECGNIMQSDEIDICPNCIDRKIEE